MIDRGKIEMAEADLDIVIRSIAKKQVKALTDAARKRHSRFMGMAFKAKDKQSRERYRHLAPKYPLAGGRGGEAAADHGGEYGLQLRALDQESRGRIPRGEIRQKKSPRRKRAEWNWPAPVVVTWPRADGFMPAMQCSIRENSVSAGCSAGRGSLPPAEKIKFGGSLHVGAAAFRYQDS
jgi:hypothetical protein